MEIETFEVGKEIDAEGKSAPDCQSIELMEKLGLKGQLKLIHAKTDEDATVCPYRTMTKEEWQIYAVLCPVRTKLDEYTDEAIPLRVLQVAAHATQYFKTLQVWHPESATVKDPVLIGFQDEWQARAYYILARWGKELAPLDELRKQALAKFKLGAIDRIKQIIASATNDLRSVESDCAEMTHKLPKYETFQDFTTRF